MNKMKYSDNIQYAVFLFSFFIGLSIYPQSDPFSRGASAGVLDVYKIKATKYFRLNGFNIPPDARPLSQIHVRGCAGQYISDAILLKANARLDGLLLKVSPAAAQAADSGSAAGDNRSRPRIDVYIAKVWFQAGIHNKDVRNPASLVLTQELLLKNDSLINVDIKAKKNFLLVKLNNGKQVYVDISGKSTMSLNNLIIEDSPVLRAFSMDSLCSRQIWLTIHIPEAAAPGTYYYNLTVTVKGKELFSFPLTVDVLPFTLEKTPLIYSIFYHGILKDHQRPFHYIDKTERQMMYEFLDMKEHGVLYPVNYQPLDYLELNLRLRSKAGLPCDYAFSISGSRFPDFIKTQLFESLRNDILSFQKIFTKYGYRDVYYYAIDEADENQLSLQAAAWDEVRKLGGKIFAASERKFLPVTDSKVDALVLYGKPDRILSDSVHQHGGKMFVYANPQAGEENPEIYRRNFGYLLWKEGCDGAMDYAYQKGYGNIWNDFDDPAGKYRDETFTYPVSNGVISTVQWEGFREGINDVRFLETLIKQIQSAKEKSIDVKKYEEIISKLDPEEDLDSLRDKIIDAVLELVKAQKLKN